jgi:enamine deaminase RidA (YjgF/YER057c/UK114 family)
MSDRERRLEELGYPLADIPAPGAIYRPAVTASGLVFVSGSVPVADGRLTCAGKVASEVTVERASRAAALCVANNLRAALAEIGSLDRVLKVVRLTGYVNSDTDFTEHHIVINGASELLLDVFGDAGLGARSAIGLVQLPQGASTETELILQLRNTHDV